MPKPSMPASENQERLAAPANLPRWFAEELRATTAPTRLEKAFAFASELLADATDGLTKAILLREMSPRSPSVRELCGLIAYRSKDFATARAELTAFRRLSGSSKHDPILADTYRAAGKPQRAIEFLEESQPVDARTRLQNALIKAAAFKDLGQADAAAATLELAGIKTAELPRAGSLAPEIKPSGRDRKSR
ncbi:MAG: hypothetical protein ACYDCC_04430 [Actinomycetota bacterium]